MFPERTHPTTTEHSPAAPISRRRIPAQSFGAAAANHSLPRMDIGGSHALGDTNREWLNGDLPEFAGS